MECKLSIVAVGSAKEMRINRNIVECKFQIHNLVDVFNRGINRNIVECKFFLYFIMKKGVGELIETLWNVNKEEE